MAILVDERSRIVIQGITGRTGATFAQKMRNGNTPLAGGVTPGRRGVRVYDAPVFDTVREAVAATGADTSLVVVPPAAVKAACEEAIAAGIRMLSIYTENVPLLDTAQIVELARSCGARVIGPNAAGVVSPGRANLSDLRDDSVRVGTVGVVSKSGTLTYELLAALHRAGVGESTVVCLGGDPVIGTGHGEILELFANDPETTCVVLLGEIGGQSEVEAARRWTALGAPKPLVAYVAGHAAPPGKRMGHAGAIVGGDRESAAAKSRELAGAGARVVDVITDVAPLVAGLMS